MEILPLINELEAAFASGAASESRVRVVIARVRLEAGNLLEENARLRASETELQGELRDQYAKLKLVAAQHKTDAARREKNLSADSEGETD